MNEPIPTSAAGTPRQAHHSSFRLTRSPWLGWRRELPRGGFGFYLLTFIGLSLFMCDFGALPGVIMATSALLPLLLGSRIQRMAAVLCLALAVYLAYTGFQRERRTIERARQTRALQPPQPSK